jgi:hypothetical protein
MCSVKIVAQELFLHFNKSVLNILSPHVSFFVEYDVSPIMKGEEEVFMSRI